jgi:pimeloyl-ACP methyl ester carboxylesterase
MAIALESLEISTTGRLKPIAVPGWLKASFRLTGSMAPGLAAAWADYAFFTPPKHAAVRPVEAEFLAAAERVSFSARGQRVAGWLWQGTGAPVLLVHGWGGHTGQMTPFAKELVAKGHMVVGLDMPGHGESEGGRSSLIHFHAAMQSAAQVFGRFSGVIAHSFGCAGVTLALSHGLVADRAVFLAPPAVFDSFWDRFCEGFGVSPAVWDRFIANAERRFEVRFDELTPAVLAPGMRVPLRILHDRGDREVACREGAELSRVWPGAELITTNGLGHNRILRDATAVAKAVEFFPVA